MQVETLAATRDLGWRRDRPIGSADLVVYFGDRALVTGGAVRRSLKSLFPGAVVIGCTTGGQFGGSTLVDGGAVAAAFHRRPGFAVSVLFPQGLVSPAQERQLTCWGDNVDSYAVAGTFDDCQRMVKEAFLDPSLTARMRLSSANSINLGRLLPQAVYYAASSLAHWRATGGETLSYVIPSGNLGNAVAAVWARTMEWEGS